MEITDLGKHKKRVGIHTDITFEITSDSDGNETSSAQQQGDKGEWPSKSANKLTFPLKPIQRAQIYLDIYLILIKRKYNY